MTDTGSKMQDENKKLRSAYSGKPEWIMLAAGLVFLLLIPFLVIRPHFTVVKTAESGTWPVYEIRVENVFPIRSVSAFLDEEQIAVSESGEKVFRIAPEKEGEMTIQVTLLNGMSASFSVGIRKADTVTPYLIQGKSRIEGDSLVLYVADDDSGVDFGGIYATDAKGTEKILPIGVNSPEGYAVFEDCPAVLRIFVPDAAGNVLQVHYSLE